MSTDRKLLSQLIQTQQPELYSHLCSAIEKELEISKRPNVMTAEERHNLSSCFEVVQPVNITDMAFVVWCGCKYIPALEYAARYRTNRSAGISYRDCYPFVSLDDRNLPDSGGVYAFKEEIGGLVAELTDSRSDDAMGLAFQIYRAAHPGITRKIIGPLKLQMRLKPEFQERYTTDEIKQLHGFIADCYGRSCSYVLCVVLAERALQRLASAAMSADINFYKETFYENINR